MKTFSSVAIASLTMVGMAYAQQPAAKGAPATPPPELAMPAAPAEVTELGKIAAGTWKCKGDSFEGGVKTAVTATNKVKVDFDKWWINESLDVKMGKITMKMATYTTFDATAKKWRRVAIDNMGGQMVGTADAGAPNAKMTFNLDAMGPMGAAQFRDHIDPTDLKAGLKLWGEVSSDKGKTWNKVYEMVCKK